MKKIWKSAKAGDEKAQKIVALLDEKLISVDRAYKTLFKPDEKVVGLYVKIPAQMMKLIWHISDTTGAQVNAVVNEALMSYLTQIFGNKRWWIGCQRRKRLKNRNPGFSLFHALCGKFIADLMEGAEALVVVTCGRQKPGTEAVC